MADPLNVLALDDVKRITKLEIAPLIASEKAIIDKLNALDAAKSGSMEDIIQDAQKKSEADADADSIETVKEALEEVNLDKLAASSEEAPVIKLANLIIVQAIKDHASDVHLEPFEKSMRLRYRVDGVLLDATPPPKQMQLALASRFKIMSSLDIAERRLPQDGRMRVRSAARITTCVFPSCPPFTARKSFSASSTRALSPRALTNSAWIPTPSSSSRRPLTRRTDLFWSPARPVRAKPRRSTPR